MHQPAVLRYGQQAVSSSSKQCSKVHTVTASSAAKTAYSNREKCSKQQQHKPLRVPTARSSDTQLVLLLYEVTGTAAA